MPAIFVVRPRTGNIGNDLIALGAAHFIRQALGDVTSIVTVPAALAGVGETRGGLNRKNIYEMNRLADGVVVGPGNMFENGSLFCELDALKSLSVPMMLLSVSSAQIYDRSGALASRTDSLPAQTVATICHASEPVVVRDDVTRAHLDELGLGKIEIGGCPSLFLEAKDLGLPERSRAVEGTTLISIRAPSLMSVPYAIHARLREELRAIMRLLREDGREKMALLCHDYRDLAFAAEFPDIPALYTEDVRQFLGWLRDCALSVTFRLHAFLPCLFLGTPSINFSYDQRATSLIETLGMAEWDINFVQDPDLSGSLSDRLANLPRLEQIKERARTCQWEALRATLTGAMAAFAARVQARRATLRF